MEVFQFRTTQSFQELTVRGTPAFPCSVMKFNMDILPLQSVPLHWHDEIEIFIVVSGCINVTLQNHLYELHENEAVIIKGSIMHSMHACGENCVYIAYDFDSSIIGSKYDSVFNQKYVQPLLRSSEFSWVFLKGSNPVQKEMIDKLIACNTLHETQQFGYEWLIREALSSIWLKLIEYVNLIPKKTNPGNSIESDRVKRIITYIATNYGEPISLSDIAYSTNISERECFRCFKNMVGIPPIAYLVKYRVSMASQMLMETEKSISHIASACGFDNASYFSKMFKRHTGMTPRKYREELHK